MLCCREIDQSVVVLVGVPRSDEWTGKPLVEADMGICAFMAEEIDTSIGDDGS